MITLLDAQLTMIIEAARRPIVCISVRIVFILLVSCCLVAGTMVNVLSWANYWITDRIASECSALSPAFMSVEYGLI